MSNARLKLAKSQVLSNTLRLNFCYLKIIHLIHLRYHPKLIGHAPKQMQKNKKKKTTTSVCIHEIIQLIITKTS